jgi:ABC-type branched-subunit amino acid transport system permease subunit
LSAPARGDQQSSEIADPTAAIDWLLKNVPGNTGKAGMWGVSQPGFYATAGYGLVLTLRERRSLLAHAFVVGVAAYVLIASAGPEAFGGRGERFRAPVIPILILYAAHGGRELFVHMRAHRRARDHSVR